MLQGENCVNFTRMALHSIAGHDLMDARIENGGGL